MAGSRTQPEESIHRILRFVASQLQVVGCPFGQEPGVSVVRLSEAQGRPRRWGGEFGMDRGTTDVTTPLLYKGPSCLYKENGSIFARMPGREQFLCRFFSTPKLTEVPRWPPTAGFFNCLGRYLTVLRP